MTEQTHLSSEASEEPESQDSTDALFDLPAEPEFIPPTSRFTPDAPRVSEAQAELGGIVPTEISEDSIQAMAEIGIGANPEVRAEMARASFMEDVHQDQFLRDVEKEMKAGSSYETAVNTVRAKQIRPNQ